VKDSIQPPGGRLPREGGRQRIEVKPPSMLPEIADGNGRSKVWGYGLLIAIVLCVVFWLAVAWLAIW